MKKEIRAVANHRALMISKWFLSCTLVILSFYLGFRRTPMTPLYILLFLNALPIVISIAVKNYGMKKNPSILNNIIKENPFLLATLKSKYKYTQLQYVSNSVSYLIALVLTGLWQYSYNLQYYIPDTLRLIPVQILAASLVVRFLGILFYRLKLPFDIAHNKL